MTGYAVELPVGARVMHDGEQWVISSLTDGRAELSRPGANPKSILVVELLARPGFRLADDDPASLAALGPTFDSLSRKEYQSLRRTEEHIREMLTGYRAGSAELALPGEPKSEYQPEIPVMARYKSKAAELGLSVPTVRRLVRRYQNDGLSGLIDQRQHRRGSAFGRVDKRWIEVALDVIDEHVDSSQPTVQLVIDRINARFTGAYGDAVVRPSEATARRVLNELTVGRATFSGSSAKQKRSIASRPSTPYGRLRASRVGEYVLLDTSPLDVFAMDAITLRWVALQLTIALDLGTRCVTGLRLSPISANAVDAALVLYETLSPGSRSHTSVGLLPYGGIPSTVFLNDVNNATDVDGLPGTFAETVVIDHGKMYLSEHVQAVCRRLGISVQPARVLTSTDKAPVERFFRTVRESLLAALPGYKGPDVYSRGKNAEELAYYFSHELESIIREWLVNCYHRRPHSGLCDPGVPGLDLSPNEMWGLLTARGGCLQIPRRHDLVYDLLPVSWRTIQHYGVEVHGLRYDGNALNGYRGTTSPFTRQQGKWPLRFDPDDASRVFFQRPDDNSWHTLRWEHARDIPAPFSVDALRYARQLARSQDRHPNDRQALAELLDRWDAGFINHPTERRLALRMSEQRAARLSAHGETTGEQGEETARPYAGISGWESPVNYIDPDACAVNAEEDLDDADDDFYRDALEVGR